MTITKRKLENTSNVLKALAHPDRLAMVLGIMRDECSVGDIQKRLSLPQSTVSQHLRILREAGIIRGRKEGTKRCYRVINALVKDIIYMMKKG